jgi:hypothetical protein
MGIFNFLKGLSEKKEETVRGPENLKLEDINIKIDSFSKTVLNDLTHRLGDIGKNLEKEKDEIMKNLEFMESKELENQNIPGRGREIIEGNKKSFATKIQIFIDSLNFPKDIDAVSGFCKDFNSSLRNLEKKTVKNFGVLQQFFGNNTKAISTSLSSINHSVKTAKNSMERPDLQNMLELKNKFNEINKTIELEEKLRSELQIAKEKKEKYSVALKERKNKIKKLEECEKYKSFVELSVKKNNLKKELVEAGHQLTDDFFYVLPSLKKYERLTLDTLLVKEYLQDHSKALHKDKGIKIVDVFEKMTVSIKNGKLELKDKKKDRILKALSKMDRNYFENFVDKSKNLKKNIKELRAILEKITEVAEIKRLKEKLEIEETRIEENKKAIENLQSKLNNINIEDLRKRLLNSHDIFKRQE